MSNPNLNPEQFKTKVTRDGLVYHGPKSIGRVEARPSHLHVPGTPKYIAKDRMGREVSRHVLKADAVSALVKKWTGE